MASSDEKEASIEQISYTIIRYGTVGGALGIATHVSAGAALIFMAIGFIIYMTAFYLFNRKKFATMSYEQDLECFKMDIKLAITCLVLLAMGWISPW